jgi:hypothetical protein
METTGGDSSIYLSWSDEELLRAAGPEREEYRPEAIASIETELARRDLDAPRREQLLQSIDQEDERRLRDLTGVRGWLLFFALVVLVNSLPLVFGGVLRILLNPQVGISSLPWLAVGAYGCYAFVLLVRKRPSAPRHAARWILALFGVLVLHAGFVYLTSRQLVLMPLFGLPYVLWFEYLQRSKRVAATYGRPPQEIEAVSEVFD